MSSSIPDEDGTPRRPHDDIPDGEQQSRIDRAKQDGARSTIDRDSPPEDISAAFGDADVMPTVQDAYRINGRTHIVEDKESSSNPDFKLIDDAYEIAVPGKAWFVLSIAPMPSSPERVRRFAVRQGFQVYWPRRVCLRVRGRGKRRRKFTSVSSLFPRYVLVHMPTKGTLLSEIPGRSEWLETLKASGDKRAPDFIRWVEERLADESGKVSTGDSVVGQPYHGRFGALTTHEGRFNGVAGWLSSVMGPVSVADSMVETVVSRERNGEFDATARKGRKRVSKLPDWIFIGSFVRIVRGPFASFLGLIEEVDEVKERLKVSVSIFGRDTLTEMALDQVAELC